MVKWEGRPGSFGAFTFQIPKQEGESQGIAHDPYSRVPKNRERKAYALAKDYAFVNLFNYWVLRDWPAPVPFTHDNAEHERQKDAFERELFLTVASCIAEADPHEHHWHTLLWQKLPREQRLDPPKDVRNATGLARHILDAVCCAVDALANGQSIPEGVWTELTQRGGLVSLLVKGSTPQRETRRFGVVGRMPWWLGKNLDAPNILHRAADSIVGSFFLYLLAVELGGKGGPRLKRCAEPGCHRVMVASGRRVLCPVHQKSSVEGRGSRRNNTEREQRRLWEAMKGDVGARRTAFLRWRARTRDARARFDRAHTCLLKDGKNPAEVGYDVFVKYWKASK